MKIKDVKPGMNGVNLTVRVVSVSGPRKVSTKYGEAFVAQAVVEDETGTIVLNLWRDQVNLVKPGDLIKIENAFAKEFRGKIELSIGRNGRITVVKREEIEDEELEEVPEEDEISDIE
jgi:replication factor A1